MWEVCLLKHVFFDSCVSVLTVVNFCYFRRHSVETLSCFGALANRDDSAFCPQRHYKEGVKRLFGCPHVTEHCVRDLELKTLLAYKRLLYLLLFAIEIV